MSGSTPNHPNEGSDTIEHDLLIVGGGINGAGIARDAAGRGLNVLLVEKDDLASHTSSASTKLIHGGLRYLEYYEFRLVREALNERENLLRIAPHIIWPMRFILPHSAMLRPAWLLRTGLFLYDNLCRVMTLPKTRVLRLQQDPAGRVLRNEFRKGFEYSDGWVQDSRLVVLNAMDAARRGATICTRTKLVGAERHPDRWIATLRDEATGQTRQVSVRALVNAAGPWVAELLKDRLSVPSRNDVRLIKGSHIVVPRMFETEQAYILQNPDRRIVFAIPYEKDFTLIGTTDIPWEQDAGAVAISQEEITYLCESVNRYFKRAITPDDVVWSYAGVRPLYDDHSGSASAVTRDYVLDVDHSAAPVLSVFGGKITTYRKLAEHALEKLAPHLPGLPVTSWTADSALPGGNFKRADFNNRVRLLMKHVPGMTQDTATRLVRNYGTLVETLMVAGAEAHTTQPGTGTQANALPAGHTPDASALPSLGACLGADLYEAEANYLIDHEWARNAEDILWRRSKLGLRFSPRETRALEDYIARRSRRNSPPFETGPAHEMA
ncbi:glycerol-3-phosphate dehydrogenase [Asaia bogorensis]|uniref:glycerol-3-phosphate dehydrogenase n=1 Tax=Asaia bogorensis TaxID=91915 RepID=UPI000EFBEE9B|nr:glycerol-3-phosphate dehydrogenase [Asaia bogorensis]